MGKTIFFKNQSNLLLKELDRRSGVLGLASGFFHPFLHRGHVEYLKAAKSQCDILIVVVNGTNATIKKYGVEISSIEDRLHIVNALKFVDYAIEYDTDNMCTALLELGVTYFLKGGDRDESNMLKDEIDVCDYIGCQVIYGVGGYNKIDSNSSIIERINKIGGKK